MEALIRDKHILLIHFVLNFRLVFILVRALLLPKRSLSGLLCNEEKSHWAPMQIGEWLGFVIDSISMSFRIPEKKVSKLKGLLDFAIQAGYSSFLHFFQRRKSPNLRAC